MSEHEAFVAKLTEILNEQPAGNLLSVPGVYEIVAEFYNNEVVEEFEKERERGSRLYNCCEGLREPNWTEFIGLEVSGSVDDDGETEAMVAAQQAEFFSVYGRTRNGSTLAITDCKDALGALAVGGELALISGLVVRLHPSLAEHEVPRREEES